MYGTTDLVYDSYASYPKFSVYVSKDLENFEGPFIVFDGKETGFWATHDYWAAEVWQYNGKYYLLEVKLNVQLERNLSGQLQQYVHANYLFLDQKLTRKKANMM